MEETTIKFILKVFIVVILIFAIIVFINTSELNLNAKEPPKKLMEVVTIEGLKNSSDAFCESHRGSSNKLNNSCGKLTKNNCVSTSCCVWTSDSKCFAGGSDGPTFNTDENGKTKNLDYYFYQDKCYGSKCP